MPTLSTEFGAEQIHLRSEQRTCAKTSCRRGFAPIRDRNHSSVASDRIESADKIS